MKKAAATFVLRPIVDEYPLNERFRAEWKRLYDIQKTHSPFSTLEWIEAGIEVYLDDKENIFPIRFIDEKGVTRAITILRLVIFKESKSARIWPLRELRTIDFNSQRTTPIMAEDRRMLSAAVDALLTADQISFDVIELFKVEIPEEDPFEGLSFTSRNYFARKYSVYDIQPRFLFSGDWDSYLMARTQGHRKKIRRYTRKLQEAYPDYHFTRLRTPREFEEYGVERCVGQMNELFQRSWQAKELSKKREDSHIDYRSFYTRIFNEFYVKDQIDLAMLHADGRLLAFDMSLNIDGHIYMVYGAYDLEYQDRSPGTANLVEIIRSGFELQDVVLEFGGGFLDYKRIWANDEKRSYQVSIARNTARGRITAILWKFGR